jgi:biotin carboxyl carrier protein
VTDDEPRLDLVEIIPAWASAMAVHDVRRLEVRAPGWRVILERGGARPAPSAGSSAVPELATIWAPMAGVVRLAPEATGRPFVGVGDVVTPDTTLCVIETGGMCNEVVGQVAGRVNRVLVRDGVSVARHDGLFEVEVVSPA